MFKTIRKTLSVLFTFVILLVSMSVCFMSFAAEETGACGSGLTWTYNDISRTLTISGNGSMNDYSSSSSSSAPWFSHRSDILKINIEEGVKKIGSYAFSNCNAFTKIQLPNSLETIGNYAFRYCYALVSVSCGTGLKSIGNNAFDHCQALTTINIPNSVESIGNYAFNYCTVLSSIVIGDGVIGIGNYAFYYTGLSEVVLGRNLQTIGQQAFYNCKLANVTMYNKVGAIGQNAFARQNNNTSSVISHVYYYGTETNKNEINFGTGNEPLLNAQWHYEQSIHVHVYGIAITKAATCSSKGVKTFTCSCGASYTEDIALDPLNHVRTQNRNGIPATCTETGYTAGIYCSDCGKWVSGHALLAVDSSNHAALDSNGNCPRCGKHVKDVEQPTEPAIQPNDEPSEKELNFFERLIQMILNFFAKLFGR